MNITVRLTLVMVLLALSTAAVVGLLTQRNLEAAILPAEMRRLDEHAKRRVALIDEVISAARDDVKTFTTGAAAIEGIARARANGGIDPEDGATEAVWRARLARRFVSELEAKADYAQFRFIGVDDGGRELLRVDRSGPQGATQIVADENLQRKGDRDYFANTLTLPPGEIYVSRIELNVERGEIEEPHVPVIRIATPIRTSRGEPFGVLILNVDLRGLFARVRSTVSPGNRVYVVNEAGDFLLHPEPDRTFGFQFGRDDRVQNEFPALAAKLGTNEGSARLLDSRQGESTAVALAPLHPPGGAWLAVIELVPKASLLATIAPVRQSSLVAGGTVALVAVGLAVWLARSLARPVVTLTRSVEALGAGQPLRIKVDAPGEIGVLARAFEKMRSDVEAKAAASQASELRYRTLFEYAPDGIVIADEQSYYLDANASACRMFGYAREEFIGLHASDIVSQEEIPNIGSALRVLNAKSDYKREWRFRRKDGSTFAAEVIATKMPDGNLLAVIRDITERKRIEARVRRLVDSNAQGVIFWNAKGEISAANDAFLNLVGYTREDLEAGRISWLAMTPPEYAHLDHASLAELAVRGICTPFEKEYIRKDGTRVAVFIGAATFEDNPGEGVCYVIDLTASKAAEAALRQSENRFRTMADSMSQLAWIARADGSISWYNRRWYAYTGTAPEQMEGSGAQIVHDPKVLPQVLENWQAAINAGQPFEMEFPLRGADGTFRAFLTRAQPMKDSEGRVVQWFGTNTDVEDLKKMELSLRATQVRLSSTLAAGSIGTWTWDIPRDSLTADEFTARAFSIEPPAAARGLPAAAYLQAIMDEDRPAVSAALAQAIATCSSYDIEYRVPQKNGGFIWLQAKGRVEGDTAGNALYFHGAVMDITTRKVAEAAVQASEEQFRFLNDLAEATRKLADPAQIMVATARMLGAHLHASRCAYADVEQDGERFTIMHDYTDGCASTVGSYQLSLFGQRAVATLHRGETLVIRDVETELSPGEGAEMFNAIDIKAIITCPLVKEGGLRAMMAVHQRTPRDWQPGEISLVQDVVERCWASIERSRSETELAAERTLLRTLFDLLPDYVYLKDMESRFLACNNPCAPRLGVRSTQELIGKTDVDFFPPEVAARFRAEELAVLQGAAVVDREERFTRPDGVNEIILTNKLPLRDGAGKIIGIVGTGRNITERKQAEDAVRRLNAELEQRVAERTVQLEAANHELEAFSYSVSHDLRAPLRAVNGFAGIVLEDFGDSLPEAGRKYLQRIRDGGRRMGELIDDLLRFSRLGRQDMRRRTVDTTALVNEVIEELCPSREPGVLEVRVEHLPPSHGDPNLLRQVWSNLLSNAFKYARQRRPAIVEVGSRTEEGRCVYFVRDNGAGFDMRYVNKLFGVFQRLHREEEFEGTGVGLAIVQRIVHRHGGRVWAEAEENRGATFYFTLGKEAGA